MCCYLELKLHYVKNLKLFSIRVKELFEPTVLRRKKNDGVFPLFKNIFLKYQSLSNARLNGKETQNLKRGSAFN